MRLRAASGVQNLSVMLERAMWLNVDWERGQSNISQLLEDDPYRERIFDAEQRYATDETAGFAEYLSLAERGSVFSMDKVAQCYDEGRGATQSRRKAMDWLRRAFEAGSTYALLNYGRALITGGELAAAEEVFKNGAADGWPPAQCWFAVVKIMRDDAPASWRAARPMLKKAAEKQSPAAKWLLAYGGARGKFGLADVWIGARTLIQLSDHMGDSSPPRH